MSDIMLEIQKLNKSYRKRKIINNLNMTVYKGDIYGFLGANGEGKTTTIRMITSLIKADSGDIIINGKSVINGKNEAIKNIGAMVEAPKFYENMSGYENLELMAKIAGCRNQTLFMERYIQIDDKVLREEFKEFDSISIMDPEYPEELLWMHNPPVLLFYSGNIDLLKHPKIAVVGSRSCSRTGIQSVEKIINDLNNELIVVSGLAKGIDTAAHMAALQNGGKTIAVIGTGLDVFLSLIHI